MTETTIKIEGAKEIDDALRSLDRRVARKALARGVRAGERLAQLAAQARAPKRTGKGEAGLRVRGIRKRPNESIAMTVRNTPATYYMTFQDQGFVKAPAVYVNGRFYSFVASKAKSAAASARSMSGVFFAGKHFMKRAFDSVKDSMFGAVIEKVAEEIRNIRSGS